MSRGQISPSDDFTKKVMTGVKRRPRKIGMWNLAYFAPIVLVAVVLANPVTQQSIRDLTSQKHSAVAAAEEDIAEIQALVGELTQFEFDDEVKEIINNESVSE